MIAALVREILPGMTLGPDLTDRVFLRIEADPAWRASYDDLVAVASRGAWTVNATIGRCVRHQTDARTGSCESRPRSTLIATYTRLHWQ